MKRLCLILLVSLVVTAASAARENQTITTIQTLSAPQPAGPYSQGTLVNPQKGKLLFVAGQVSVDPKNGKPVEASIQLATHQAMDNVEAILKAAGSDWRYVVRTDVFLKDINDWEGMNKEYSKRFPDGVYPARQTIQVGMKNRIEISAIAFVPDKH
jgi:2-iminobutanoate/2-iminopropanoate deaminase